MSPDAQPPREPAQDTRLNESRLNESGPSEPGSTEAGFNGTGLMGFDQHGQPTAPHFTAPYSAAEQPTAAIPPQQGPAHWHTPQPTGQAQWPATQPNPGTADTAPWDRSQYEAPPPFFTPSALGDAPSPRRGRTGWYVGVGAGAVVVAGVVAAVVAMSGSGSNPTSAAQGKGAATMRTPDGFGGGTGGTTTPDPQVSRDLIVPLTAGPLRLLINGDTELRISDLKKNLSANGAYPDPQVGFYRVGSAGSYSVWMLAQSTTDLTAFQDSLGVVGVSGLMKQITQSASMKDVTVENPGQLGGALDCGKLSVNGTTVHSCVWVDANTFGWVYFAPNVSQNKFVAYTQDLRAAAEHGS